MAVLISNRPGEILLYNPTTKKIYENTLSKIETYEIELERERKDFFDTKRYEVEDNKWK